MLGCQAVQALGGYGMVWYGEEWSGACSRHLIPDLHPPQEVGDHVGQMFTVPR
jgi:hypothetical protein